MNRYAKKMKNLLVAVILLNSMILPFTFNISRNFDVQPAQDSMLSNEYSNIKDKSLVDIGFIQKDYKADGSIREFSDKTERIANGPSPGVDGGDHPLGIEKFRFIPNNELAFVCTGLEADFTEDGWQNVVDINLLENAIGDSPYTDMIEGNCDYTMEGGGSHACDAVSGDLDGDHQDELVIVDEYGRIHIFTFNMNSHKFENTGYDLDLQLQSQSYCISLDQFNSDPGLELVIGTNTNHQLQIWDPVNYDGTYYKPGVRTDTSGEAPGGMDSIVLGINLMDLETADFDADGKIEIVAIGYNGDLMAFKYEGGGITQQGTTVQLSNGDGQGYPMTFPMAIGKGDFDGDSQLDVCVMKCDTCGGGPSTHCENYFVQEVYWKEISPSSGEFVNLATKDVSALNIFFPSIGAGDIDGDGVAETVLTGKIGLEANSDAWKVLIFDDLKASASPVLKNTFEGETACPWAAKSFSFFDSNLDGTDEICFSTVEEYGNTFAEDWLVALERRKTTIIDVDVESDFWEMNEIGLTEETRNLIKGFPVPGDYDGDSVVLEYSGNHYPRISPQIPIFVMAAPPVYVDLNGEGSCTAISKEFSASEEVSERFSVSAGIRVSFESGFELFGQGVTFRSSFETNYQFSQTETTLQSETMGTRYSSGYDANQIVCDTVDYESYIYSIIDHPNPSMMGKNISIDIPTKVTIYSMTESLYNNASSTNTIGMETYSHTPGQPGTYPTIEEVEAFDGVVKILEPIEVTQGKGIECGSEITYARETEKSIEKEQDLELIFSTGVEAGGVGLDVSVGYGQSWANKVTYGTSMIYEGSVGGIADEEDWLIYKYSFGLFIQNIQPSSGFAYQLVHYYTEGDFPDRNGNNSVIDLTKITEFITENPERVALYGAGGVIGVLVLITIAKKSKKKK